MKPFFICLLALLAALVCAQGEATEPKIELKLDAPKGLAGKILKGKVILTFAPGLHGYQNPPTGEYQIPVLVKVGDKVFKLKKAKYPAGKTAVVAGEEAKVYEGTVVIPVEIELPKKAGTHTMKLVVSFQQCNETACWPPSEVSATAKVIVTTPKKS